MKHSFFLSVWFVSLNWFTLLFSSRIVFLLSPKRLMLHGLFSFSPFSLKFCFERLKTSTAEFR